MNLGCRRYEDDGVWRRWRVVVVKKSRMREDGGGSRRFQVVLQVNVDVLMTHDVCGPGAIDIFKKQFGSDAKVWDHIGNFKGNLVYKGVCHVALAQEGHCRFGEVLLGTDSQTCTAGAFGQFATGIGNTDAGFALGTGKLLLKAERVFFPILSWN
ncbi:hypothetical protein L2E82_22598 [Cichorium intybus]|uniref:Uncharacterized protein n=1 Tax=Cichorium intybus TaxID=13427 RepID=A0ACB9DYM9_CICIN|nr:hypothetical protein L2E82_22598 [Cichorium intybus]